MASAAEKAIDMDADDQVRVNEFAVLNVRHTELGAKIGALEIKQAEDAELELLEGDGGSEPLLLVGGTFFKGDEDNVTDYIAQETERFQEQIAELQKERDIVGERMSDLRAQLSAKLGKAINLDFDAKTQGIEGLMV